jgi:hypothetical protein
LLVFATQVGSRGVVLYPSPRFFGVQTCTVQLNEGLLIRSDIPTPRQAPASFMPLAHSNTDSDTGEDTDDGAVFADTLELASDRLATISCVFLGVAGKCLLLAAVPVLVEAMLDFVGGGERR